MAAPDLTAREPDFAPQLDEEDGVSRVLAEGDAPLAGDLGVLQEAFDHLAPELRLLLVERPSQGGQMLLRQTRVRLDAQVAHRFGDRSSSISRNGYSLRPPRARLASEASFSPVVLGRGFRGKTFVTTCERFSGKSADSLGYVSSGHRTAEQGRAHWEASPNRDVRQLRWKLLRIGVS